MLLSNEASCKMSLDQFPGLIHAITIEGDGYGKPLSTPLPKSQSHTPHWVHLNFDEPSAQEWLRTQSGVDPIIADALLADESRPRFQPYESGLLLILRGVNLNPSQDPEDMVSIRMWIEPNRIISTRRRVLLSVQDIHQRLLAGHGPKSLPELVIALSKRLTGRIADFVDNVDQEVTNMEEQVDNAPRPEHRQQVSEVKREIIALRRYLLPMSEAFTDLEESDLGFLDDRLKMLLIETHERLMRKLDQLDAISERTRVILEDLNTYTTDLLNQRMYLLSIISAVFLPLGFLTGLLGVNIGGIPGTEDPLAFTYFVVGLVVISLGLIWYFYRNRWM
jgi:zinc transporter